MASVSGRSPGRRTPRHRPASGPVASGPVGAILVASGRAIGRNGFRLVNSASPRPPSPPGGTTSWPAARPRSRRPADRRSRRRDRPAALRGRRADDGQRVVAPAVPGQAPFRPEEAEAVGQAVSPSTGRRCGMARACRTWDLPCSTLYFQPQRRTIAFEQRPGPERRGPLGPCSDEGLVGHIRRILNQRCETSSRPSRHSDGGGTWTKLLGRRPRYQEGPARGACGRGERSAEFATPPEPVSISSRFDIDVRSDRLSRIVIVPPSDASSASPTCGAVQTGVTAFPYGGNVRAAIIS